MSPLVERGERALDRGGAGDSALGLDVVRAHSERTAKQQGLEDRALQGSLFEAGSALRLLDFRIGDQIRHGEQEGTVEDIWVRATVLRTYDNRRILIPNASLFTDKIEVITAYERRRLQFALTIGNGDEISRARDVVVQALRSTPGVLADPVPEALVTGLGTAGVDMVARFWINPPRRREAVDALDGAIEAVKQALAEAGLDLPFPTTQVLFHDQTEETDGDRARQREGWPAAGRDVPRPRWQAMRDAAQHSAEDRR